MHDTAAADQAAWIVASLPAAEAELILRRLPSPAAETLRSQANRAATLRLSGERAAVVRRFIGEFPKHSSSPKVHRVDAGARPNAFHFLRQQLPSRIAAILAQELPQTAATVLTQLPPNQAADVLAHLAPGSQRAIAAHLRECGPVDTAVLQDLAEELQQRVQRMTTGQGPAPVTGQQQLSEILSCADEATRQRLGTT